MSNVLVIKETLTKQVCSFLKSQIINGELVAGDRIWADTLAETLGVSIAPVKEALLILTGEGLIHSIPRRGSIIRVFSVVEVKQLYDVRRMFELEALHIIFSSNLVTDELVDSLDEINRSIGQLRNNGEFVDRKAAYELDWKFHDCFMQSCQQDLLIELYARLNTQAQIIRCSSWNIGPRGDKTFNEHQALIDALYKRDINFAIKAIKSHVGSIVVDFEQSIAGDENNSVEIGRKQKVSLPSGRRRPS